MTILAIDAASVSCSACVEKDGKVLAEAFINTALTHSVTLLSNVKRVMEQSETGIEDIDLIAVTAGPGSFTGVKIGVACAKGLAFERDIPCFAVSSLQAAAESVSLFGGTVVSVMDARRNSFYNAVFENGKRVCAGSLRLKNCSRRFRPTDRPSPSATERICSSVCAPKRAEKTSVPLPRGFGIYALPPSPRLPDAERGRNATAFRSFRLICAFLRRKEKGSNARIILIDANFD